MSIKTLLREIHKSFEEASSEWNALLAELDVIRGEINAKVPAIIVTADYSAKAASDVSAFGHELLKKPIKPAEMRSLLSFLLAAEQSNARL